jgi:hypothetical protein
LQAREDYVPATHRRAELILGPTGPFRKIIERYMEEAAPARYIPGDLVKVRGDIASFFRYVFGVLNIDDLDDIRPSTVTSYVESRRAQGYTSFLFVGRLATFFVWAISAGLYDNGNPVVNRLHRKLMTRDRDVRSIDREKGQYE